MDWYTERLIRELRRDHQAACEALHDMHGRLGILEQRVDLLEQRGTTTAVPAASRPDREATP